MKPSVFEQAAVFIRNSVGTEVQDGPLRGVQLVETLERRIRRKSKIRRLAVGGACALAVIGSYSAIRLHKEHDVSYRVGASPLFGVVGSYVSASSTQTLDLNFSEGSQVVLQPRTRVRVTGTTSQGATMVLESGRARADIVHRPNTNWRIFAGPYVVSVTGTSFEVSYEVATQRFDLDMHSGVVKVWGPSLVSPVEVRNGQRFTLGPNTVDVTHDPKVDGDTAQLRSNTDEDNTVKRNGAPVEGVEAGSTKIAQDTMSTSRASAAPFHSVAAAAPAESWSRLSARGQHRRIVELAEQQGLEAATATASGPDLFALGNSARFAGKPEVAVKAYRALRERFSSSPEASGAAFFLGRLSESSDPGRAIAWYEKYVAEAPAGAWVADALGRRMVILNNTNGTGLAQAAAKDYLARFPNGPYAGFARVIALP